jgi:hypothetical protein
MVAKSEIIIPLEILQLVDEYRQLTRDAAISQRKIAELEHLAQQIPESASKRALAPLTEENTPIAELDAVLHKLPIALTRIQQLEGQRQQQRSMVQQTQFHASSTMSRPEPMPVLSSIPRLADRVHVMLWFSAGIVILVFIFCLFVLLHR